jgi:hypothetical protein
LAWVVVTLLLGCSAGVDQRMYRRVDLALADSREEDAAREVYESGQDGYGERNRLIFHLDLGFLLHLSGYFKQSATQFEQAERLAADLYTRSVSAQAGSLLTSDNAIPYGGEEFELVLINVINALNYACMGDIEAALVEARRVDSKFRSFARQSEGRYRGEPFALYLVGLFYEEAGDLDNAWISLSKALEVFQRQGLEFGVRPPEELSVDLARLGYALDRTVPGTDFGQGSRASAQVRSKPAEIVVIHHLGPGPRKVEQVVEVSVGQGFAFVQSMRVSDADEKDVQRAVSAAKGLASSTQVTVAYPVFHQPAQRCRYAEVQVDGQGVTHSEMVQNVTHVARINLEDRMKTEWPRFVARAVVKFVTARAVGEAAGRASGDRTLGFVARLLTQATLSALEAADIRCWRTLPASIHMTRVPVEPGEHRVLVRHGTNQGGSRVREYTNVRVEHGKRTFLVTGCY